MSKVSAIGVPVMSIVNISKVGAAPFPDRVRVAKFGYDCLVQSADDKGAQVLLDACDPSVAKAVFL